MVTIQYIWENLEEKCLKTYNFVNNTSVLIDEDDGFEYLWIMIFYVKNMI